VTEWTVVSEPARLAEAHEVILQPVRDMFVEGIPVVVAENPWCMIDGPVQPVIEPLLVEDEEFVLGQFTRQVLQLAVHRQVGDRMARDRR
jgi:hypothetical protein